MCCEAPLRLCVNEFFCFKKIKIKAEIVLSPGGAYFLQLLTLNAALLLVEPCLALHSNSSATLFQLHFMALQPQLIKWYLFAKQRRERSVARNVV